MRTHDRLCRHWFSAENFDGHRTRIRRLYDGSSLLHVQKLAAANRELEKQIAGREQAEEALRHAQKMEAVGRLAGGVAHDFNNVLMVIRGQAALSLNAVGLSPALRQELGEIVKAADRASY